MKKKTNDEFNEEDEKNYQAVLDELLDKINRMGFDSLTPREKEMLEEASRNLSDQKKRLNSDSDEK
ncbi:MAG: DUF6576 domain-containing protein [Calditrichia bacterium]